jgi:hypothetical protein
MFTKKIERQIDEIASAVMYINPFRSYVGPRPTLRFSFSTPMSENVRHIFFCLCARSAVGGCPTLFLKYGHFLYAVILVAVNVNLVMKNVTIIRNLWQIAGRFFVMVIVMSWSSRTLLHNRDLPFLRVCSAPKTELEYFQLFFRWYWRNWGSTRLVFKLHWKGLVRGSVLSLHYENSFGYPRYFPRAV